MRATLPICTVVVVLATPILSSGAATHQSQSQSPNPGTSTGDVVNAATGYLAKYEQQLTSVVAMEVSSQRVLHREPADNAAPRTRELKSEMFFMFSRTEHEWMAVRDVHEVDGKAVKDPVDLKKALTTAPLPQLARTLKGYSSRYNIGTIVRNFGEPTFSLMALDANYRGNFGFAATRIERKSDATLVTIYFREHGTATLLHSTGGAQVLSEGELIIEAGTGRIRHAVLRAQLGSVHVELTTTFQPDTNLDIWVPSSFSEQYDEDTRAAAGTERHVERIHCDAKYSNFRRFEAFGQIK